MGGVVLITWEFHSYPRSNWVFYRDGCGSVSDVLHMTLFPTVDQAYAYVRCEDVQHAVMMGSSTPTSAGLPAKSAPRSGPSTRAG
ncbi:hypothetical protein L3X38_045618 [Prunus dulcis]|uniref:Uncharacterized protein n=1 Tax=Prunus dulcis TaxID=3755 RepID=A0AAD4YIX8_PRUDU|nr:hypothetical protein L3X38_045618 [Prunus dulcis]